MDNSWTSKTSKTAHGTEKPTAPGTYGDLGPDLTEDELNDLVVVLVVGKNVFGDDIFSYVQLPLGRFKEMALRMVRHENFKSSDYGTVLAAGRGLPSPELKKEMADNYNVFDIEPLNSGEDKPAPDAKPFMKIPEDLSVLKKNAYSQPKFWGDEEEEK
jgi:hypothetical protein